MKKLYFLVLYLLSSSCWAASFDMSKNYKSAYSEILNLRFQKAEKIILYEKANDRNNVAWVYLESYSDFLKAIISEENESYKKLVGSKNYRVRLIESVNVTSPWRLYALGQLYLQSSIAEVKQGELIKAALDVRKSYNFFYQNSKKFPEFAPNRAGLGLLYTLIGSIPDSYSWIPGILGMEGDVNKGISELREILTSPVVRNNQPYLFQECFFLSSFIAFNLSSGGSVSDDLLKLVNNDSIILQIKQSPLLIYATANIYSHNGMNDKALELLINRPQDTSYFPFLFLDYLTGIAYLNKLDTRSRGYFLKYITHFKGQNYLKAAYQRLAWSYLIEGDTANYQKYLSRIGLFGKVDIDNDKEAMKEYNHNATPNRNLLRARLLFDGGYYSRALTEIQRMNQKDMTLINQLEGTYRTGRIKHKLKEIHQAKVLYRETYEKGKNSKYYFSANALLNLGNIYEQEGNFKEALWCYKTCTQLDFDEYRTTIQQKAKAGIDRITKKKAASKGSLTSKQ